MSILQLQEVSISYADGARVVQICDSLSLSVSAGIAYGIVGRSGSGKSSILRVAAGLQSPTSGTVRWSGNFPPRLGSADGSRTRRRFLGYSDQNSSLVSTATAWENVLLPSIAEATERDQHRDRAQRLVERFGLTERRNALPSQLSGGEAARVSLARALLLAPTLLVADEPTASLDVHTAETVIAALRDFREMGGALFLSTHDPRLIALADEITYVEA